MQEFSSLEKIGLKAVNKKPYEEETGKVVSFYKEDFVSEVLKVQLKTVKSIIRTVSDDRFETFHHVRKSLMKLNKPAR